MTERVNNEEEAMVQWSDGEQDLWRRMVQMQNLCTPSHPPDQADAQLHQGDVHEEEATRPVVLVRLMIGRLGKLLRGAILYARPPFFMAPSTSIDRRDALLPDELVLVLSAPVEQELRGYALNAMYWVFVKGQVGYVWTDSVEIIG